MSAVTCDVTISVDGFVAGPNQSRENPLGERGEELHTWIFNPQGEDQAVIDAWQQQPGAYMMGRNMFGPDRGEWDLAWTSWWGEEPPYRTPVFVLSHDPRADVPMKGGTTFHFVTDGIEAVRRARDAAGGKDVAIAGDVSTINECLTAGLIEELRLRISPLRLGARERLFAGVGDLVMQPVDVIGSSGVTHVTYRIGPR